MRSRTHHGTPIALLLLIGVSLLLSASCAAPQLKAPDGFVKLDDDQYWARNATYKAVSPDNAVLLVRVQEDQPEGTITFWSEVFSKEFIEGRGYELIESKDIRTRSGFNGKLLRMRGNMGEEVFRYDIAVFLWGDEDIITIEASVPEALFDTYDEKLLNAIESMYID